MLEALISGRSTLDDLNAQLERRKSDVTRLEQDVTRLERELSGFEIELSQYQQIATQLEHELDGIHTSRYWKVLGWYWRLRHEAGRLWRRSRRAGRALLRSLRFGFADETVPQWVDWDLPPAQQGKVDILVFPIIDWDFRFQRPQQLARGLAQAGHRVFYLATMFNPRGLRHTSLEPNMYQIQLPGSNAISIYQEAPSEADVERCVRAMLEAAHAAGIAEAVCLVELPYWGPLAIELSRTQGWKLAYDCMDDHTGFSTNTAAMVTLEVELLSAADLVLSTSEKLHQYCLTHNENARRLPNAAEIAHFAQASERLPPPDDFPAVDGPVVGYIGAISDWFDFDLLRHAVEALPQVTFYLIGDTWGSDPHADLAAKTNVYFAGEKPYQDLPAYLAQFDICLIPFKDNLLTQSTDPVKLYEYLAAGKQIVARDLPELAKFGASVHLAESPESFTQAIRESLEEGDAEAAQSRQLLVNGHDWSDRVDSLQLWLDDLFEPVSLIVPVWNQLEQTRACLESLLASTCHPKLEVIVVDNGSLPETVSYLDRWASADERFKVFRLDVNQGFAPAVNLGLQQAKGELLGILNNDILLTRGWLSKLVGHLKRDPSIGMIGPLTNEVGNEARLPAESRDRAHLERFASQVGYLNRDQSAPIPMLAMFCVLLPRPVYQKVGGLDERFSVGMFEDDDYAIRLRRAGYRPVCARDVFIHHHGQASFNQLGTPRYRAVFQNNQTAFETKWGILWQGHSEEGLDAYQRAAASLKARLASNSEPAVILSAEDWRDQENWLGILQAAGYADCPRFYWHPDGWVELDIEGERTSKLPWVALDTVESLVLIGREALPPQEIWLRLRDPRYVRLTA
jgi:GT2 family glycosyltransferase/glycosyltransferase involved in cell wall biosynthesis